MLTMVQSYHGPILNEAEGERTEHVSVCAYQLQMPCAQLLLALVAMTCDHD